MNILAYFFIALSIFLLLLAVETALAALERYYRINDTRQDNAALLERVRAQDRQIRHLQAQLSSQAYQRSSIMEEQLQEAQEEAARLTRELKVKDSLLRAVDGKNGAKA